LSLIDQAKRSYGFLPTLRGVITDTGTYQSKDLEEDLNPQLACIVEGRGRCLFITATMWHLSMTNKPSLPVWTESDSVSYELPYFPFQPTNLCQGN